MIEYEPYEMSIEGERTTVEPPDVENCPSEDSSSQELLQAVLEDRQRREQQCSSAVEEALRKYRCELHPRTIIVSGQVSSDVVITAT